MPQHHAGNTQTLAVIDVLLTISSTTSECERDFQTMHEIKTDWCSSLFKVKY